MLVSVLLSKITFWYFAVLMVECSHCQKVKYKVYKYSSSQSNLPHRCGNSRAIWDHTVLPATRQRWHSRLYSSRSWYSIKRPRRDARLSWHSWLVTYRIWYTRPKTVTHPSTNRAQRALTSFMLQTLPTLDHCVCIFFDWCFCSFHVAQVDIMWT